MSRSSRWLKVVVWPRLSNSTEKPCWNSMKWHRWAWCSFLCGMTHPTASSSSSSWCWGGYLKKKELSKKKLGEKKNNRKQCKWTKQVDADSLTAHNDKSNRWRSGPWPTEKTHHRGRQLIQKQKWFSKKTTIWAWILDKIKMMSWSVRKVRLSN